MQIILQFARSAALRRTIGWICLLVALVGAVMPVIPGWPALIGAIVLLGRRDPLLRWLHLWLRRGLRALRRTRITFLRNLGVQLSFHYVRSRRALLPAIIAAERALHGKPI